MDVNKQRGYLELVLGFVECESCAAKSGTPMLCRGCLFNRSRAQELRIDMDRVGLLKERVEALQLQRDQLQQANTGEVLKRRAADAHRVVVEHEMSDLRTYVTSLEDHVTELSLEIGGALDEDG